jgi:hypothetical protein
VRRDEEGLECGRSIAVPDQPLDAGDVEARTPQEHQWKEQFSLPARKKPGETWSPVGWLPRADDQSIGDVRIEVDLVRVGVVGVVLCHPPAEAKADQPVGDRHPQNPIGSTRAHHLLVPGIVSDESKLREHDTKKCRDTKRAPRITKREHSGPSGAIREGGEDEPHAVATCLAPQ